MQEYRTITHLEYVLLKLQHTRLQNTWLNDSFVASLRPTWKVGHSKYVCQSLCAVAGAERMFFGPTVGRSGMIRFLFTKISPGTVKFVSPKAVAQQWSALAVSRVSPQQIPRVQTNPKSVREEAKLSARSSPPSRSASPSTRAHSNNRACRDSWIALLNLSITRAFPGLRIINELSGSASVGRVDSDVSRGLSATPTSRAPRQIGVEYGEWKHRSHLNHDIRQLRFGAKSQNLYFWTLYSD